MNKLAKVRAEVEKLKSQLLRGACSSQVAMETRCKEEAYNEVLAIFDTMQEEPISEDLEEACEQLAENARKHKAETSSPFFSQTDYRQGVIDGVKWKKEQMMAKVVDGEVTYGKSLAIPSLGWVLDKEGLDFGDKVKLIFIKEG